MNRKKLLYLVQTAMLLALLVAVQALTQPFGQMVTGSCVNGILALGTLLIGVGSGAVVGLISPVMAFLLGIAPNVVTVPVIMAGNLVYVLLLGLIARRQGRYGWRLYTGLICSSIAKFGVLSFLVSQVVCGIAAESLLEQGLLKPPMLAKLTATFSWPQLFTALIGGGVAVAITPLLRKALKK